ncbi:hypothetical protein C8Q76DRAFT_750199 [Earliella scabrosa]|nr:hypothetical protein C8Q76DRAFT_750199 [Earliella scabrosa]
MPLQPSCRSKFGVPTARRQLPRRAVTRYYGWFVLARYHLSSSLPILPDLSERQATHEALGIDHANSGDLHRCNEHLYLLFLYDQASPSSRRRVGKPGLDAEGHTPSLDAIAHTLTSTRRRSQLLGVPSALSALTCELFFARRVWLFGRRKYRPLIATAVALDIAFFGCYSMASCRTWNALDLYTCFQHAWLIALGSGLVAVANVTMSTVLIYTLHKSRTGIKRSNWTINILIRYALASGSFISVFELLAIITVFTSPKKMIFLPMIIILTKSSPTAFLVSINARSWLASADVPGIDLMSPFTSTLLGN